MMRLLYAVLLPSFLYSVSPKILGRLGSIYFGLALSFLIPVSFHMLCAQRACVPLSTAASLYVMNRVFGSSLSAKISVVVCLEKRVDGFL